jgi:4-hydroxybenzoate polyprenyltransferase
MIPLILSLRPKQWVKNTFVLLPLIFSKHLFERERILGALAAFASYCLISGAIYLVNDIVDREKDRVHPAKSKRPIPAGDLGVGVAACAAALLVLLGLSLAFFTNLRLGYVVVSFLAINLAYSAITKQLVILDVMSIAAGFLLRVLGGAVAISVFPTPWILICTVLLALFLGFGKRRHEILLLEGKTDEHRTVLKQYSPYFLDQMIGVVTASAMMSYLLYTISEDTVRTFGSNKILMTTPFVLYGIFRYLYLVHEKGDGGDPTSILIHDPPMLINVVLWGICSVILIYFV